MPAAGPVLDALHAEPTGLLVAGGIGTGKTTLLAEIRASLQNRGHPVVCYPPERDVDPAAAVVIDDAHLLGLEELARLVELANDSDRIVVAATEPRDHDPGLSALICALERRRPRLRLGALDANGVAAALAGREGQPVGSRTVDEVLAITAGIPLLVTAAGADARGTAVSDALTERIRRLPQQSLEALLVTSLGDDFGPDDVAGALALRGADAFGLLDRVRATGLAEGSQPRPFGDLLHRALARTLGAARHHEIESALVRTQFELGTMTGELALRLAEHGLHDERMAGLLRDSAASARDDPALLARLLDAAVRCGAGRQRVELADALARCGACAKAVAVADDLLAENSPADRAAGVRTAAAVAAHDGDIRQAAELFGWLGPFPDAAVGTAAAIVLVGVGQLDAAAAALAAGHTGVPTAAARATRNLGAAVLASITRPYPVAAAALGRAAAGQVGAALPDSAAALATLTALHNGDAPRARSVIARAVAGGTDPLYTHRHRLLRGWGRMQDGRLAEAAADIPSPDGGLHRRDALWSAALRTAIARRNGDTGALHAHWNTGVDALAECAVDLYTLLPLGELWVAAARLGQADRLDAALDQAREILDELGNPVSWSPMLHWAGLHAGMAANDPAAVVPHAQALAAAAAHSPFAAALAGAGRTWLQVLAGDVRPDAVVAAARGLARFGLSADATRLAGQAALNAPDSRVSAPMLQTARDLKVAVGAGPDEGGPIGAGPDEGGPGASPEARPQKVTSPTRQPSAALSEREREVAELLLLGMPYRDIGAQLFISAKTVEHHVARIRRRLGAGSRSEMLSMLRTILTTGTRPEEG